MTASSDPLVDLLLEDPTMGQLMRSTDWAATPLGPIESWPRSLISYVAAMFALPTPAIIFWGPEQTQIYNDGYSVIMGPRHPRYFGAPYRESWPDTYPLIYPWMQDVLRGEVKVVTRTEITVTRYGYPEEAYFSFTFSPLRDDDGVIQGILQPVIEVTEQVIAERRAEMLHALSSPFESGDPIADGLAVLAGNPNDVPFAAVYLAQDEMPRDAHPQLRLVGQTVDVAHRLPALDDLVRATLETNRTELVDIDPQMIGWSESGVKSKLVAVPFTSAAGRPGGVVAFGTSPRLRFDEPYQAFLEQATAQLAAAITATTERTIAQHAAEREREQLYALFEQAPAAVAILTGPDLVFTLANAHYFELVGNRPLLGLPAREALPEIEGQGIFEILEGVYSSGEPFFGNALPLTYQRHPDAAPEEVFFNFVYQPLRDVEGNVEGIMAFAYDVTEQVRASQAVDEARAAAESANRAKDQFLAILGHELRNPLAPIMTALEVMRLRGNETVERERAMIERQTTHVVRLVDDLLDVSRITRGKVELRRAIVEVSEVVTGAIEMASPAIEERRHQLVVDVPAAGLTIHADAARMAQVIANLLTNAAKYTEVAGTVTLAASRDGDEVVISVTDNGIGISPQTLPTIFDMFVQEHQPLDRPGGGLGLGLTIVRSLVEMHGGKVAVHSEGIGRGSRFEVRIAAATASPGSVTASVRPPTTAVPATAAGLRVLLVDDNVDFADVMRESLGALGHELHVANDGPSALLAVEEFRPDVAVLDLGLPIIDGYEVARQLRARVGLESIRLVALSGYGLESDQEKSREAGFDAHLVKPVEVERLDAVVRQLARNQA